MKKKQQDIIIYWLDAIRYGDELDMPYVQDIMKKSVVFENAYAYVANTHPMLRAMFLGKKDIEDFVFDVKKITRENSVLISFLEDEGYDIMFFKKPEMLKNKHFRLFLFLVCF